ncbi:MAG: hypothetical protein ACK4M8_02110 [Allorhizobium sp.]
MRRPVLCTRDEAERIMELWGSRRFDTYDIGKLLNLHESVIARTIQAMCDMRYLMLRGLA